MHFYVDAPRPIYLCVFHTFCDVDRKTLLCKVIVREACPVLCRELLDERPHIDT